MYIRRMLQFVNQGSLFICMILQPTEGYSILVVIAMTLPRAHGDKADLLNHIYSFTFIHSKLSKENLSFTRHEILPVFSIHHSYQVPRSPT